MLDHQAAAVITAVLVVAILALGGLAGLGLKRRRGPGS